MVSTLWQRLFSQGQSDVQRGDRRARVRQRRIPKPWLEALEERCLLSYQVTDLGTLPGDDWGFAYGINNFSQVVGRSQDSYTTIPEAFLWDATRGMQAVPGQRHLPRLPLGCRPRHAGPGHPAR